MKNIKAITPVILGAATGYQAQLVEPFVSSLVKTGYRGALVLFINPEQLKEFRQFYSRYEQLLTIDLVSTSMGRFKAKHKTGKLSRTVIKRLAAVLARDQWPLMKRWFLQITGYPHVVRFIEYQNYLTRHPAFSHVLLSDVRDVVFQRNPFEQPIQGLYVGMESPEKTIGTEEYNRSWILDAYGEHMLEQLKDKQISCSGVTLGDRLSMDKYIDQMMHEFLRQPYQKMSNRLYDQAMHNKLLHQQEINNAILCQPLASDIATVGIVRAIDLKLNTDDLLINQDGSVAAIVHQYDRHAELSAQLLQATGCST